MRYRYLKRASNHFGLDLNQLAQDLTRATRIPYKVVGDSLIANVFYMPEISVDFMPESNSVELNFEASFEFLDSYQDPNWRRDPLNRANAPVQAIKINFTSYIVYTGFGESKPVKVNQSYEDIIKVTNNDFFQEEVERACLSYVSLPIRVFKAKKEQGITYINYIESVIDTYNTLIKDPGFGMWFKNRVLGSIDAFEDGSYWDAILWIITKNKFKRDTFTFTLNEKDMIVLGFERVLQLVELYLKIYLRQPMLKP